MAIGVKNAGDSGALLRAAGLACAVLAGGLGLTACSDPNTPEPTDTEQVSGEAGQMAGEAGQVASRSPLPRPEVNAGALPPPPSQVYPGLFEAVAVSGLYEPKDWVDTVPKAPPSQIMDAWRAAGEPQSGPALQSFADAQFNPPERVGARSELDLPPGRTLMEHIAALWPVLTREAHDGPTTGSLLPLPHPYIVPGGRFREVYYWDAYFTMLGLDADNRGAIEDMVRNFAAAIEAYGFIPNANRTYYLSRSQPPFFYLMVGLLNPDDPRLAWAEYLPALRAEHAFWTDGADGLAPGEAEARSVRLKDGALLNRYWDARDVPRDESYVYDLETAEQADRPSAEVYRDLRAAAESGWDFSSRWMADGTSLATTRTTSIIPVDLNSLLYGLEAAIAEACAVSADMACADAFDARAKARAAAMRRHLWNAEGGYFDDYDLETAGLRNRPTAAMVYPLFFGVAADGQATATALTFRERLLAPGGVLATPVESGEQWDSPNGWAPLQYLSAEGFLRYGMADLAEDIAGRWVETVALGFCESGKLVEKYDVLNYREGGGGEYPTQDGFGWTNGVTQAFLDQYESLASLGEVTARPGDTGECRTRVAAAAE